MSSKTSSRSTLTTVPSTMSPSLKYLMVSSIPARKASSDPISLPATLAVEWASAPPTTPRRLSPHGRSLLRAVGGPAEASADEHVQRPARTELAAHGVADEAAQHIELAGADLEDPLVVALEQHPASQPALTQLPVHREHRHLDPVRGGSL